MHFTKNDISEILNNALPYPTMEVSDEWCDWAKAEFETIFEIASTNYHEKSLSIVLLRSLRVAIDCYEYCRVAYLKEQPLGGIHESDFQIIMQTLFDAAGIGHFFMTAYGNVIRNQYVRHIIIGNHLLFGTHGAPVPVYALNLSIQGRQYLRQQLGELNDPPEIKPDEFKSYNPSATQAQVTEPQTWTVFQRLKQRLQQGNSETINNNSMAQAISKGGDAAIVNAPVFNNPPIDLSPLAEAQKYGFDMIRSAIEASRQPSAVPPPAPEPSAEQTSESAHASNTVQQENIADRLNLRQGKLRNLIEALDNDRIAGNPINATIKRKELGIIRALAKLRGDVSNLKIDKNDKELLLALLR